MLEASVHALMTILTPFNFVLLVVAVLVGLVLGAIPGLGGITGLTILLPFVFKLSPESSMVLLIGLAAVICTGDTIPAILLGVPGTVAAQATILDGFPMAKRGEAGRAFGASYTASMLGGIVGAVALMATLPILRPLVLIMGSPELFMVAMLGISMISTLTGKTPWLGLALGLFGIMITMIGQDPQTGIYKWTFGQAYLLDGVPLVPAVLGLFAIPELMDLITRGKTIASRGDLANIGPDLVRGIKDAFRNWFLVLRCSLIGVFVGFVPGLGSSVVDWIAYAHVRQTVRNKETLGFGDVRGVIGPESANNSKEGGALIPTIAFGVPGSMTMVILLGAFMMAGIAPGPDMVGKHLDITYTMIWTLVLANILGAGICLLLAKQVAKLCHVRLPLLVPLVSASIFVAATQATAHIADLIVLLVFTVIGWTLKKLDWPRPPIALGMVLGPVVGKYLFISLQAYGLSLLIRPGVLLIGAMLVASLIYGIATNRQPSPVRKELVQ